MKKSKSVEPINLTQDNGSELKRCNDLLSPTALYIDSSIPSAIVFTLPE